MKKCSTVADTVQVLQLLCVHISYSTVFTFHTVFDPAGRRRGRMLMWCLCMTSEPQVTHLGCCGQMELMSGHFPGLKNYLQWVNLEVLQWSLRAYLTVCLCLHVL